MKMFIPNNDHYNYMRECIDKKPEHTIITSFGVYCGITNNGNDTAEWGDKYITDTRDIADKLNELGNAQFLIGLSNYRSCAGNEQCVNCEMQYIKQIIRLSFHAEKFTNIEWRMTTNLHLKCALFFYGKGKPKGVAGSRNLTNSDWADITFNLDTRHIYELYDYVNELWGKSLDVTDSNINKILEEQNISEDAIRKIVGRV